MSIVKLSSVRLGFAMGMVMRPACRLGSERVPAGSTRARDAVRRSAAARTVELPSSAARMSSSSVESPVATNEARSTASRTCAARVAGMPASP